MIFPSFFLQTFHLVTSSVYHRSQFLFSEVQFFICHLFRAAGISRSNLIPLFRTLLPLMSFPFSPLSLCSVPTTTPSSAPLSFQNAFLAPQDEPFSKAHVHHPSSLSIALIPVLRSSSLPVILICLSHWRGGRHWQPVCIQSRIIIRMLPLSVCRRHLFRSFRCGWLRGLPLLFPASLSCVTSALRRAHHACTFRSCALRVPSGYCVLLFHRSEKTVPAAAPPQQDVFVLPCCTPPAALALHPSLVFYSRVMSY